MAVRADIEGELIDSLGPRLTYVGLDGSTRNGSNASLNGPIRRAIRAMGYNPSNFVVADADIAVFTGYAVEKLIDYARLETLTRIAERCTDVDMKAGQGDQKLKQFHDQVLADIRVIEDRLSKPYGPTLPPPSIGTMLPDMAEGPWNGPNDPFAPYRSRSRPARWPYP